jgi:hypothetical protein
MSKMKKLIQESSERRRQAFEALANTLKKLIKNPQQQPGEGARSRQPARRRRAGAQSGM